MTVTINGQPEQVDAETLAGLVEALGLGEAVVATALNGAFVPKPARPATLLHAGDRIEIVAPMQGG